MAVGFGGPVAKALNELPVLGEDMYLRMQAINLSLVDGFIRQLEGELLREYIETERTPMPSAVFVSALSQLWLFGVYELIRTWRQRCIECLTFAMELRSAPEKDRGPILENKRSKLAANNPFPDGGDSLRVKPFERVAADPVSESANIQSALDRSETLFRRLEALRMHLAKHEMPKQKGSEAIAPGYGRIDMSNGSINFQVLLRDDQVDLLSRRDVAEGIERLSDDPGDVFLPVGVRTALKAIPEEGYGLKRVRVTLADGSVVPEVFVVWNSEVLYDNEESERLFRASEVIHINAIETK